MTNSDQHVERPARAPWHRPELTKLVSHRAEYSTQVGPKPDGQFTGVPNS